MGRARKICNARHCSNLQPCPEPGHSTKPWEGSTRSARLPSNWPRLRAHVLMRDPICRICNVNASTEVDHIQRGDDHSLGNLQGVCTPCHTVKTQREAAAARGVRTR